MKKFLALCLGVLLASSLFAVITGSAHDFQATGWAGGEICLPCHIPHNSDTTVGDAPLWNHTLPAAGSFTPYGTTLAGTVAGAPNGISLLCLSCHDGVTNVDAYGGGAGTDVIQNLYVGTTANVGQDLTDDHPVSIVYNTANELRVTTTVTGVGSYTIGDWLFTGGTTVECSSCHDVHNKYGNSALLKLDNSGSALCLLCHIK